MLVVPFAQDLEHKSFQDSFLAALREFPEMEISHFPLTDASDVQILEVFGNKSKDFVNAFGSSVEADGKKKNRSVMETRHLNRY